MKVSLAVLRFEISDHSLIPHYLKYRWRQGGGMSSGKQDEKDKKSYANIVGGAARSLSSPPTVASGVTCIPIESTDKHRGARQPKQYTIQSIEPRGKPQTHDHRVDGTSEQGRRSESGDIDIEIEPVVSNNRSRLTSTSSCDDKHSNRSSVSSDRYLMSLPGGDDTDDPRPVDSAKNRHKSHSPGIDGESKNTVHFFSGNPSVETTEGIMHLYKDNQFVVSTEDEDVKRPDMICILGVPANMNTKDLIQFTAPVMQGIEHIRIIRDSTPNQYMALLKFRSQRESDEFYRTYNNVRYNSLETDVCHLVYISRIETLKASEGACFPVPGLTELPNCPVCLERMDESVDGILTILCNHSFHGNCLTQWGDTSCPVCRYVQTPDVVADNKCQQCESQENLWICLICGCVGCGRYQGGHARRHYEDTLHTFAMQLGNNRVWDYAGDNYVHRLVQNKSDGKLVEVNDGGGGGENIDDAKLESLTLEYTYLLTSQLESQRLYFEEKMQLVEEQAQKNIEDEVTRSRKTMDECERLDRCLQDAQKEKISHEKKNATLTSKLNKLTAELKDEKELNRCLRDNQLQWQNKFEDLEKRFETTTKEKDQELQELKDQLRDIMFYLEAQQKIANSSNEMQDDIQGGQIIVGESSASGYNPRSGRRGRKKGR
ncbi:BRCA1-associated protein-like [Tubulanus polymorphus]|uniref:BRCA1-associated protein-like n=1 Tax=Tubulanus polymorphus TaxID=672921 RepID=UPI003DA3E1F3